MHTSDSLDLRALSILDRFHIAVAIADALPHGTPREYAMRAAVRDEWLYLEDAGCWTVDEHLNLVSALRNIWPEGAEHVGLVALQLEIDQMDRDDELAKMINAHEVEA